jgi:excisionase family DNA binding protein
MPLVEEGITGGTSSGLTSGTYRTSDRDAYYTVSEAAKVLGVTNRRVRALAQEGRIEGQRTEGGWQLFRYSVHSFRERGGSESVPRRPEKML